MARADSLFRGVLERSATNSDAWEGRAHSAYRLGDVSAAVAAAQRALQLAPNNPELRAFLDQISPEWKRTPFPVKGRSATLQLVARTRGRQFEISTAEGWRPFYIQGVNLGVALPGRYPSEFPTDSAVYAGWLDTLAAMNANTLRLYTILPPSFYRALRGWNLSHPDRTLWLVHGVWTELPPGTTSMTQGGRAGFRTRCAGWSTSFTAPPLIPPRPGHAAGRYDADVSRWVLGYIIGREWEPFAVKEYDARK